MSSRSCKCKCRSACELLPSQLTRNELPSVLVALVRSGDVYLRRRSEHVGEEELGGLQGGEIIGVGVGVAHKFESETELLNKMFKKH